MSSPRKNSADDAFTDKEREKHAQIEADIQQLLTDMQTSFKSFSETIFTKIDTMQQKFSALEKSVTQLPTSASATAIATEEEPTSDPEPPTNDVTHTNSHSN